MRNVGEEISESPPSNTYTHSNILRYYLVQKSLREKWIPFIIVVFGIYNKFRISFKKYNILIGDVYLFWIALTKS